MVRTTVREVGLSPDRRRESTVERFIGKMSVRYSNYVLGDTPKFSPVPAALHRLCAFPLKFWVNPLNLALLLDSGDGLSGHIDAEEAN